MTVLRYVLHIEGHWGYMPRISIRRIGKHGDRTLDGGEPGTLQRCPLCQDGFLFLPDTMPAALRPTEETT